jgi:hypothetical protein
MPRRRRAVHEEIRDKLDLVDEAFLHDRNRRIDQQSYERQRDKLRQDLALAQLACTEASVEELDVETVLAFAETTLTNAARLWTDASLDQKQRLQSVLFPEGVTFDGVRIGTTATCLAFNQLPTSRDKDAGMASPLGFEPALNPVPHIGSWGLIEARV